MHAGDGDLGFDEPAVAAMSTRIGDRSTVDDERLAGDQAGAAPTRPHQKTHVLRAILQKRFQGFHVQGRRARARIQLGLDRRDAEQRQRDPFAPAERSAGAR